MKNIWHYLGLFCLAFLLTVAPSFEIIAKDNAVQEQQPTLEAVGEAFPITLDN
jgi:hypothetical protein